MSPLPPRGAPAASARLRWGLWLPTRAQEAAFWAARAPHAAATDRVYLTLFLLMHLPMLGTIIPRHALPGFILGVSGSRRPGVGLGLGAGDWAAAAAALAGRTRLRPQTTHCTRALATARPWRLGHAAGAP